MLFNEPFGGVIPGSRAAVLAALPRTETRHPDHRQSRCPHRQRRPRLGGAHARFCWTTAEQRKHANSFLRKAGEYLASADDNLGAGRHTPAAGDAIHAGISAKDAMVTALTGSTNKGQDHAMAAKELKQVLGRRPEAATAEKALRELLSAKGEVEYGVALVTSARAEPLVRRARDLVELATQVVRLGR